MIRLWFAIQDHDIDYDDDCGDDCDDDCDNVCGDNCEDDYNDVCGDVCDDDASVPMSSGEGHLVPMNTKAATTIQAVDKLTILGSFFCKKKKQTTDDSREPGILKQ